MTGALICLLLATLSSTAGAAPAAQPVAASGQSGPRPAKGRFLVASRNLTDPNFSETVLLLLSYGEEGAMALVINHPTDVRLASVLPDLKELQSRPDVVHQGGPVGGNLVLLLIRAAEPAKGAQRVFADVYVSGSMSALRQAVGRTGRTSRMRAYAGHAGWGPGQLDREIAHGDWYVTAADAAIVFDADAAAIWSKLVERSSGEWTRQGTPPGGDEYRVPLLSKEGSMPVATSPLPPAW